MEIVILGGAALLLFFWVRGLVSFMNGMKGEGGVIGVFIALILVFEPIGWIILIVLGLITTFS